LHNRTHRQNKFFKP